MKKGIKLIYVLLIVMTLLSLTNLLGLKGDGESVQLAGLTVIVGVVAFFATRKSNDSMDEGLDLKTFPAKLKNKKVILLMLAPIVIDVLTIILENKFFPEVLDHIWGRADFIETSKIPLMIVELIVFALGEEIAIRAFYQKQTTKLIGFVPSLILTSAIFALGHFTFDRPIIVVLDLLEVFVDSLFFGLVFKETDNAWCSWLSHFVGNVVAIFLMLYI